MGRKIGATNQATWLNNAFEIISVGPSDLGKSCRNDVFAQTYAIAVNPVDWVMQSKLLLIKNLPAILKNSIAGEITEVGDYHLEICKGQRVPSILSIYFQGP
jgi:NADPH:quinone reductase-like Zn-dependent oxidoreductase